MTEISLGQQISNLLATMPSLTAPAAERAKWFRFKAGVLQGIAEQSPHLAADVAPLITNALKHAAELEQEN